jgi:alkylated DNA nucleotide flippase Atl1
LALASQSDNSVIEELLSTFSLGTIVDRLNEYHQRATYGAVASLVGRTPRNVMQGLKRGWRYSWIVNQQDGEPSEYNDLQKHPALRERATILSTAEELTAWLTNSQ